MKISLVRKYLLALLMLSALCPSVVLAQDLTGIWRGYFITDGGDQYKYELQIQQTASNRISGVSYSYLDTRFYGKATLTGNFTRASNAALVQEIRTVEVKMDGGSTACIMKCRFVFSTSGREQFLEGTYTSTFENGLNKGGSCGGGRVMLRKVPNSDFYIEPFLRNKTQTKPPVTRPAEQMPAPAKPAAPKPATPKPSTPKPATKPVTKPATPAPKPKEDTVRRQPQVIAAEPKAVPKQVTIVPPPAVTRSRQNELTKMIEVRNEEITVKLYDNGEIDGDTISVYLDGRAVVSNKGLSTVPITLKLKLDESNPEHTLIMVAENLGRIPPNTSLMVVTDGDSRYEVSITSTEQKNAMVRFRYRK